MIRVTSEDIRTEDRGEMPPHLSEYGETPETYCNWQAMFQLRFGADMEAPIRGCPLGTGRSEWSATMNLLQRTANESNITFKWEQEDGDAIVPFIYVKPRI
jgi:hypothetical protein